MYRDAFKRSEERLRAKLRESPDYNRLMLEQWMLLTPPETCGGRRTLLDSTPTSAREAAFNVFASESK